MIRKQDALDYHSQGRKGKIEVISSKPCSTQRDLSLAYTPGVAEPCLEIEKDPKEVIKLIRYYKKKVGISIKPKTDLISIENVFSMVDMVLIMTVEPGFGGQGFILDCLPKIEELRKIFKKDIEVDGGVNEMTARDCLKSGANVFVAGSYVFGAKDYALAINKLRG